MIDTKYYYTYMNKTNLIYNLILLNLFFILSITSIVNYKATFFLSIMGAYLIIPIIYAYEKRLEKNN